MKTFEYQNQKRTNYFEGWYVRIIDPSLGINRSIIFALTKDQQDPHAFLQLFDAADEACEYIRYPLSEFRVEGASIFIGPNSISPTHILIDEASFACDFIISNPVTLTPQFGTKSAMGFVSYFPLQTAQEVVYLNARLNGVMRVQRQELVVDGQTYIEKTYGHRFPPGHIWLQSAHFDVADTYFSFSVGVLPLLGMQVKGWFAVLRHDKDEYRFAIYNLARLKITKSTPTEVELVIKRGRFRLEIQATRSHWVKLVGPTDGASMTEEVLESIDGSITLNLYFNDALLLNTTGQFAGFENTFE
jgi:hypothetical protein